VLSLRCIRSICDVHGTEHLGLELGLASDARASAQAAARYTRAVLPQRMAASVGGLRTAGAWAASTVLARDTTFGERAMMTP